MTESLELRFNKLEAEFRKLQTDFYSKIRKEKPKFIVSNNAMQKILKQFPQLRANQIDDLLLSKGIGDEKALKDYLDLLEKNKKNEPLIKPDSEKHD